MAGDGVSLQTNITQLGNVAKSQARSQQSTAAGAGQAQELDKEEVKPLEKVRETDKAEKKRVDEKEERAKQRRRNGQPEPDQADVEDENRDQDEEAPEPGLGGLVDLKA